jgi:hypothetical protein
LAEKVEKLPAQLRKAFHGKVAELAEARSRGLVLTKSRTSPTWDLTEKRFGPRNFQMKIYARHGPALSSLLDDLDDLDPKRTFSKRGILTKDTLERGVKGGQLVREGTIYRPVGRSDIELHSSKAFLRPAESQIYAKTGREMLIKRGLTITKSTPTGFQTASKMLGRVSILALVATEGYVIHGFAIGRSSEREFFTAQSVIAGGGVGGYGGFLVGAGLGALVPPPFNVITIPVGGLFGGVVGAVGGAMVSEWGASSFYGRLDTAQKQQVEAFIYRHFGVSQ